MLYEWSPHENVFIRICYHSHDGEIDPFVDVIELFQENLINVLATYYNDVIMGAIASQITSLMIVYSTVFSDADKKNIKAPRHWPLCGEFTGDRWIPRTNGQ